MYVCNWNFGSANTHYYIVILNMYWKNKDIKNIHVVIYVSITSNNILDSNYCLSMTCTAGA